MMDRLNKEAPAYKEGYLTNGKPITEANIKEMLDSAKESMPDYTPWDTSSTFDYNSAIFWYSRACASFSGGLSDYIFGKDAPVDSHQNFDQIKVGDVLGIRDSSTGYDHAVLVTDVSRLSEGRFIYCEGNTNKTVRWESGAAGRMDRWTDTRKAETFIYTRY